VRGLNPEDRTYLNFDKVETLGTSDEIPVLVVPVGKRIEFQVASADVIHSFWVPEFLFKRDVIPGRVNQFELTIDRTGTFVGRCAELCGVDHDRMNFSIKVVSEADFDRYIADRQAQASAAAQPALTATQGSVR